jgi:transposase-like protein
MALCRICSSVKVREVNLRLLQGAQVKATAKEFGLSYQMVRHHRRFCLPWRDHRMKKAETSEEKMAELEFELRRLTVLGECGDKIGPAIQAVRERRNLLELAMRAEHRLGATHKRLFPPEMPEGEYEVEFVGGKPRGKTA